MRCPVTLKPDPELPGLSLKDIFTSVSPDKARNVDLSPFLPPVRNQGAEGSCSAESGVTAAEYLYRKIRKDPTDLAVQFLYECERQLSGTLFQDSGARLWATQQALTQIGVVEEKLDPYTPEDFVRPITPALLADAARHKVTAGYKLTSLGEILAAHEADFVVQIGVFLYLPQFESAEVAKTGIVPMPSGHPEDYPAAEVGGHAMVSFGQRVSDRKILVRNSWGPSWGLGGNCEFPFEYFDSPWLMSARVYTL